MPLGMNAPKLCPALPLKWISMVSSGKPSAPQRRVISLPTIVPTTRWTLRMGRTASTFSLRSMAGAQSLQQDGVVERLLEAVVLRDLAEAAHVGRHFRLVQNLAEVQALGLPVVHGLLDFEPVAAADHLVHLPEAELGHQLAHFLGDHAHEVDDVLRLAGEALAQLRVLGGDAHRAGVEVADAHHDAAHGHQRRGGEAEFLRPEQGGDDHVAPGLQLAVGLDDDARAQVIEHQRLVRLGQAQLPRDARVLDAGLRRSARAAVVAADQHHVRVRLGDARRRRCRRRPRTPA